MEFLLKHTRGIIALTLGTDKLTLWLDIFFVGTLFCRCPPGTKQTPPPLGERGPLPPLPQLMMQTGSSRQSKRSTMRKSSQT